MTDYQYQYIFPGKNWDTKFVQTFDGIAARRDVACEVELLRLIGGTCRVKKRFLESAVQLLMSAYITVCYLAETLTSAAMELYPALAGLALDVLF